MSDSTIALLRWGLLASALLSFAQATVLFRLTQRRILEPWLASGVRRGAALPPLLRDERFQRAWPLLMAVLLLGVWWYLGTVAGAEFLRRAVLWG